VARRSLSDVERLAANLSTSESKCESREHMFGVVELALGWPEGLSVLISLDLCPLGAMITAACAGDAASLRELFKTKRPVFARPRRICSHCGHYYSFYDTEMWLFKLARDSAIMQTITDELVFRRKALNEVAIQVLHPWERESFGLESSQMLDHQSTAVYKALVTREKLPYWLEGCGISSPHHIIATLSKSSLQMVECSQLLFTAGFRAIDTKDECNRTPLQLRTTRFPEGYVNFMANGIADVIFWFLQRGASPIFDDGLDADSKCWPTVLFYLFGSPAKHWNKMEAALFASLIPHNSVYPIRDGCQCFCSDGGCVAPSMVWRRAHSSHTWDLDPTFYRYRGGMLEKFCSISELDETQMHSVLWDFCRAELFLRLGMAHTCCARQPTRWGKRPSAMEEEDRTNIQEDESEFAAQLEMLMAEYEQAYSCFEGDIKKFWGLWWGVVDAILPPLTVEEANQHHMNRRCVRERRDRREREALHRIGYDPEMAFLDIITSHFSKLRNVFSEDALSGNGKGDEHPARNHAVPTPNGTDGQLFREGGPGPWPVEDFDSCIMRRFVSHECCCGVSYYCRRACCGGDCGQSDPGFSLGECCCVEEES